ncbi:MAG: DUF4390 domain-containing protein [Desulfobacteraceae bacterium]|nr:MAG: DUF4390 domain-containing protein [Desulfobacteraceae bacterium]
MLPIFISLLLAAAPAFGRKAYLSDIVVTNTRDHLLLYFTVNDCFTPQMNTVIESGLNTTFTFFVKVYEKRSLLWNKLVASSEISHSIKYDHLKNVYEVRLSETDGKPRVVKSFEEAKRLMSEVTAFKVMPLQDLRKGGRYEVMMMAELDRIKLPLYLHYVLFFLSLWDFETDWTTVDFRY